MFILRIAICSKSRKVKVCSQKTSHGWKEMVIAASCNSMILSHFRRCADTDGFPHSGFCPEYDDASRHQAFKKTKVLEHFPFSGISISMKSNNHLPLSTRSLRSAVFALMLTAAAFTRAQTIWTGPNINFTQFAPNASDTIVAGVVLTRGANQVLYNTAAGESFAGGSSPADTEWAFGSINNYATLSYTTMESLRNGDLGALLVTTPPSPMVLHLVNENIYLSVTFTAWGEHFSGGFAYTRSTAGAVVPPTPTVSITNPAAGATFTAPASVSISASASVSSGTVTNVAFFAGSTALGSAKVSPFTITANNLAAGGYALTAVATAAGVSATSAVVNITVNPAAPTPTVSITNPAAGAVFAAPANVKLAASASVSSGTVTNVTFFNGATALGSATASPFAITASNLTANTYSLTAVAKAAGVSATSAVVSISVVTPVAVSNTVPAISAGHFSFDYTANPGLTYVIARSSNLVTWLPIATNVPSGNPVIFTDNSAVTNLGFYRVVLQPNP